MNGIPIRGTAKGSAGAAFTIAKRRGAKRLDFLLAYLTELYAFAPRYDINADVLVAQADLETGAFTSDYYTRDGNVAGFGVPSKGPAQGLTYGAAAAARAQVIHHCAYLGIPVPDDHQAHDPRWVDVFRAGFAGTVTTTADLGNGKWATDPNYARKLRDRYTAYWGDPSHQETPPMAKTYSTVIPGLPGGPLITFYPVHIKLVPAWRTLNRSGIKAKLPRVAVQHGNGNPNSSAAGEATYLYNGAGGRQASYHSAADDKEVWVMVPADEVTWQAADGSGPGNMNGFSCEMVEDDDLWASPQRRVQCMAITGDFMGRVSARLGITKPQMHWDFNYMNSPSRRHHCVDTFLDNTAFWQNYRTVWSAARADELKRMAGGAVTTPPPTTTPAPFVLGDILTLGANTNLRRSPGTKGEVVTVLAAGSTVRVQDASTLADGFTWYRVHSDTGLGFIAAGSWVTKTGHQAPVPTSAPVAALLKTDLEKYDTAEGIVSDENGTEFVFVADVIEVTAEAGLDAYLYADRKTVLRHLAKGDRFVAAWVFKYEGEFFYLEPADAWGRIPYEGTMRVSDAPLKVWGEEAA